MSENEALSAAYPTIQPERAHFNSPIRAQIRVWLAIMLRDMRARFFGNGLGYVVIVGWPICHIGVLLAIYSARGMIQPYGDSLVAYIAVGLLPVITFIYFSRFTMLSIIFNSPLLSFPVVKPLDLLLGHAFLEVINAFLIYLVTIGVVSLLGYDMMPRHLLVAFSAFGASLFLGLGFGILNGVIASFAKIWATGYAFVIITLYITSGTVVSPDSLPEKIRDILWYNPAFHLVEWMRSAYYDGYGAGMLDKSYVLCFALATLFLGLVLERFLRGRIS